MSQCYRQLRLDEREAIFRMKDARLPVSRIAERLGRHPSTIYRELRRNFFFDEDFYFRSYFASVARKLASDRRVPGRTLARNPELASYVIVGLRRCWSPEQIAGQLRFACQNDLRVSHETIYQYVYGVEGKRQEPYRLLPWSRRCRRHVGAESLADCRFCWQTGSTSVPPILPSARPSGTGRAISSSSARSMARQT